MSNAITVPPHQHSMQRVPDASTSSPHRLLPRVLPRAPPAVPNPPIRVGEKRRVLCSATADAPKTTVVTSPVRPTSNADADVDADALTADSLPEPPSTSAAASRDGEVNKLSPWSIEFEPVSLRTPQKPTMRDLTFTYLWGQKVYRPASGPLSALPSLRWLAKNFSPKVLQEGPKCKLVCRLMLRMEQIVKSGHGSWDNAFEPHRTNYYEILRHKFISRPMYISPSPNLLLQGMPEGRERMRHDRDGKRAVELIAHDNFTATEKEESRNAATGATGTPGRSPDGDVSDTHSNGTRPPHPSLPPPPPPTNLSSPSATADSPPPQPQPHAAVASKSTAPPAATVESPSSPNQLSSQLSVPEFARLMAALTVNEETRRAPRSRESWDTLICGLYNDPTFRPSVDVRCILDETIDPSTASVYRDGPALRRTFLMVQSLFVQAHLKWSEAQQINALGRDTQPSSFRRYVNAVTMSSRLSSIGRMACVMFIALRCGRDDQLTEMIEHQVNSGGSVMAVALAATNDCTEGNVIAPRRKSWKRRKMTKRELREGVVDAAKTANVNAAADAARAAGAHAAAVAEAARAASAHVRVDGSQTVGARTAAAVNATFHSMHPLPLMNTATPPLASDANLAPVQRQRPSRPPAPKKTSAVVCSPPTSHVPVPQPVDADSGACCGRAVQRCISAVAGSAVQAAVEAALAARQMQTGGTVDVVDEIGKLGYLYSMKARLEADKISPSDVANVASYIRVEIAAVRHRIESLQKARK